MGIVYTDQSFPSAVQTSDHILSNANALDMWVNGATGEKSAWVTTLRSDQCLNTAFHLWGTDTGTDEMTTFFVTSAGAIKLLTAGVAAVCSNSGNVFSVTQSGNYDVFASTGTTDNKINIGWYTNLSDGKNYLTFVHRLDEAVTASAGSDISANGLFVKAV